MEWSDELVWTFTEAEHLLLNACDHGGAPRKDDALEVLLPPGEYRVQRGDYGWADDDPALVLFRFLPSS
ncbi:MAG: hypothetical protein K0Q72_2520 [Armatimonadetes bacterium]|nr:hypothetical protein [Armatimonadota bacterium]